MSKGGSVSLDSLSFREKGVVGGAIASSKREGMQEVERALRFVLRHACFIMSSLIEI